MKNHWTLNIFECIFQKCENGFYNFCIEGGADFGQLVVLGSLFSDPVFGKAIPGSIILEINRVKISGCTQHDVISLIDGCQNTLELVMTSKNKNFSSDIRHHLSSNCKSGSFEDSLQDTIRLNLYKNVRIITTNPSMNQKITKFQTVAFEEFYSMEEKGKLLEVAYYDGNLYGTPKPSKKLSDTASRVSSVMSSQLKKNEENQFEISQIKHETQIIHDANNLQTSNIKGCELAKNIFKRRSECDKSISKNITLRHYAVWIEKSEEGFGLKILSVIDDKEIFIKPGEPLNQGQALLQLRDVIKNSPAYFSGIMKPGDIFLRINNEEVRGMSHKDIKDKLNKYPVGSVVKFVMCRALVDRDADISISAEAFSKINGFSRNGMLDNSSQTILSNKKGFENNTCSDTILHAKTPSVTEIGKKSARNILSTASIIICEKSVESCDIDEEFSPQESDHVCSKDYFKNNDINSVKSSPQNVLEQILIKNDSYQFTVWPIFNNKNNKIHALLVVHSLYHSQLEKGDFIVSINEINVSNISFDRFINLMKKSCKCKSMLLNIKKSGDESIPSKLSKFQYQILSETDTYYPDASISYHSLNNVRPIGYGIIIKEYEDGYFPVVDRILIPEMVGLEKSLNDNSQIFSINCIAARFISKEILNQITRSNKKLQIALHSIELYKNNF